jgi:hypothetical protein
MTRVTRQTDAGRAYLDLQNRARRERRSTQELLTLYVVERWLARLSSSRYSDQFVLKGGMLLATYNARRPTADADALAIGIANDEGVVVARVAEIAALGDAADGVEYHTESVTSRVIRDEALYAGVRVTMDAGLATASVKFRIDVNFGDPITPAARLIDIPPLRPNTPPVRVLGYPLETVLAEKIATAITLGAANTRLRDYADIYTLTCRHDIAHSTMYDALRATAQFRRTTIQALSTAIDNLVELRQAGYTAYRRSLGPDGEHLPPQLSTVVATVTKFADNLVEPAPHRTRWYASDRRWNREH